MSKIDVRLEDLGPIGAMTINSCETDLVDFEALSSDFSVASIAAARTQMGLVDAIINPLMLIAERVVITQRMDESLGLLLEPINNLEYYVIHAIGLTIGVDHFGISEVRAARNSGNLQALDTALRNLLANTAVPANMAALVLKGYSVAKNTVIVNLRASLNTDNVAQVTKDKAIATLRTDNVVVLNNFWGILSNIWQTGKLIYKVKNPANAKFYTLSHLKALIHNNSLHGAVSGTILLAGVVTKDLALTIKPVLGGHLRKTSTDKDSNYDITSLAGGQYAYTVYQNGLVVKAGTFVLATAQKLVMDIAA